MPFLNVIGWAFWKLRELFFLGGGCLSRCNMVELVMCNVTKKRQKGDAGHVVGSAMKPRCQAIIYLIFCWIL